MFVYDLSACIGHKKGHKFSCLDMPVLKQYDSGISFRVGLTVCKDPGTWKEHYEPYVIPNGATAILKVQKPDKTFTLTDAEVTSGNVVCCQLPSQAATAAGHCAAEISLYNQSGERITTATFHYEVEKGCVDEGAEQSTDYIDIMGDYIQWCKDSEKQLIELNTHPPIPGDGGYWLVWDLDGEKYVTSSLPLPDVPVGPPGQAATITVCETVTGEPGTQAAVENTGTENAAVLRFTIPRGAAGPTGATPDISVEVTGLPAGSEPTAEVSGTPEQPVIALGIPAGRQGEPGGKGDPGTPGKDGSPGQTPTITIGQVETLPAGSHVTASITGETPNLVLNLGIPQGKQGEPGQAATIEIAETETVAPDTPAAMVELPESTPQARRYKAQVPQGIQGPAGADGYTPERGVDYWTEADRQQMVQDVIDALPVYNGEVESVG